VITFTLRLAAIVLTEPPLFTASSAAFTASFLKALSYRFRFPMFVFCP